MKHALFIRTYHKDLHWLKLSLATIFRYATGFDRLMITFPFEDLHAINREIVPMMNLCPFPYTLQPVQRFTEDYIGQQNTKLHADTWLGQTGLVTFIDSDTMLTGALDASDLLAPAFLESVYGSARPDGLEGSSNGYPTSARDKPVWLITPYGPEVGDANCWQAPTEKYLDSPVAYEFMRRLPITLKLAHLAALKVWYAGHFSVPLQHTLWTLSQNGSRHFSEFNLIGAFIHATYPTEYHWVNTLQDQIPKLPLKQYWSWGGLQQEHIEEINGYLHQPLVSAAAPTVPNPKPLASEPVPGPDDLPPDPAPEQDGDRREIGL